MFTNLNTDLSKKPRLLGKLGDLSYKQISAVEFKYRKDSEIFGEGEAAEYLYQVIDGAVRATNFCLTVAARSARFTWLAMSLGSKTANTIASRPKPSLIPPFGL